jgi:hypothetical protein
VAVAVGEDAAEDAGAASGNMLDRRVFSFVEGVTASVAAGTIAAEVTPRASVVWAVTSASAASVCRGPESVAPLGAAALGSPPLSNAAVFAAGAGGAGRPILTLFSAEIPEIATLDIESAAASVFAMLGSVPE